MGEKDLLTKRFMSKPDIFADAFNYLIYRGEHVIDAGELVELDTTALAVTYASGESGEESVQKVRDVLKEWVCMQDGRATYMVLGIENQSHIHYAMPVRNMLYDAIQYENQVKKHQKREPAPSEPTADIHGAYLSGFGRHDRLKPVITLVIYFGEKPWDAPMSIYEMCGGVDEQMRAFVQDYKIHLIQPATMSVEQLENLTSEFREAMLFIKYRKDKDALRRVLREDKRFQSIDRDTAAMLRAITGTRIRINESEEKINMCTAIQEMMDESRAEGVRFGIEQGIGQGIEQGIEQGIQKGIYGLIRTLHRLQFSNDQIEKELRFEYHLTEEQAKQYLQTCDA